MKTISIKLDCEDDDYSALQVLAAINNLDNVEELLANPIFKFMEQQKVNLDMLKETLIKLKEGKAEELLAKMNETK
jgi:hypothetical protein